MCVYILCIHIYTPFSPPWICFLLFHCNPCYSPPITSIAKDFSPKSRQVLENLSQLRGWSSGPVLVCIKVSFFGLPRWFNGKEFTFDAGDARDVGWISALGRSPGVRKSSPLQYSCLGNSMDREPGRLQSIKLHSQTGLNTHSRLPFSSAGCVWLIHKAIRKSDGLVKSIVLEVRVLLLLLPSRFSCVRLCAAP